MGTSHHPAVGPVALDSLVVAIALGTLSITNVDDIITAAIFLAAMVGVLQILMGVLENSKNDCLTKKWTNLFLNNY